MNIIYLTCVLWGLYIGLTCADDKKLQVIPYAWVDPSQECISVEPKLSEQKITFQAAQPLTPIYIKSMMKQIQKGQFSMAQCFIDLTQSVGKPSALIQEWLKIPEVSDKKLLCQLRFSYESKGQGKACDIKCYNFLHEIDKIEIFETGEAIWRGERAPMAGVFEKIKMEWSRNFKLNGVVENEFFIKAPLLDTPSFVEFLELLRHANNLGNHVHYRVNIVGL
jgi:hypothetical protein